MPSINLIATRREEKRRTEQHIRRLFYIIMIEIGCVILVSSIMVAKIVTIYGQIAQLNGQVGLLQPKVAEIQALQKETAELKPKVAILNEARNNTLYWYTALQTVSSCLPDQAWLTSISTTGDPSTGATPAKGDDSKPSSSPSNGQSGIPSLTITGQAANNDEIGLAMLKMNQFANIDLVTLGSVNQNSSIGGVSTMSFNLAVQLKPNTAADASSATPGQASQASAPAIPNSTPVRQAVAEKGVNHA